MLKKTQKEQQQKRARQKRIASCVLAVVVLNAALGYWLYGTMVLDVQEQRLEQLTREHAQLQASRVERYLREQREAVQEVAAAPETLEVFAEEQAERRAEREQQIADQFPHSLAARLIPVGSAQRQRDHAAPIGFAELQLIRRAERRAEHQPEMARVEQEWQLHLIAPVPPGDDQPVRGTLMVTLEDTGLRNQLTGPDAQMGRTRLHQRIPGSGEISFFQQGISDTGPEHQVAIPNSHWQLNFSPSSQLVEQSRELPTLWLLVLSATSIAGLLLAWALGYVLNRRQGKTTARPKAPTDSTQSGKARGASPNAPTEDREHEEAMASTLYQDQDILDLDVDDEDEDILELSQEHAKSTSARADSPSPKAPAPELPQEIFRSYDIRGLADSQLTPELAEHIGRALGSEALEQGETHMIVARDGRNSSPALAEALRFGITRTGCHVIDLGVVPTPLLYFATHHLEETSSGVMVTASHNAAAYNGFKMVINGSTLADDAVLDVRSRIQRQHYQSGEGETQDRDIIEEYIERIFSDVALMGSLSLVIDAGNAVTGLVAPRLFEELGCKVTPLHCELDGNFPNHDPDPTCEANLQDLIGKVKEVEADLGVAFDGDGDRLVVVTAQGRIIWPDQLLMLFARDILARSPGADVIFDVKCSRQLNQLITSYGGRPIMWKTGHSHMKSKMIETRALIGGEYSGHIFIKDRWYGFDDGLYAFARLLEIITLRDQPIDDIFAAFPILPSTPELKVAVAEEQKFALVEKLIAEGDFHSGKATTIDGLRVDFAKGWGLVRASNTSAALTLRFEAEDERALEKIQLLFKRELLKADSSLSIDF